MKYLILLLISVLVAVTRVYGYFQSTVHVTENIFVSSVYVTPSSVLTPSQYVPLAGDIVINEINWAGSRVSTSDEWIELRNMTAHSVDLSGWKVENLGGSASSSAIVTIPAGRTIVPHGLFVIANASKISSKINMDPDVTTTAISLLDSGEELRLRSQTGTLIDTANRVGAWFKGAKTPVYRSMERRDTPGNGSDASSWQDATTHTGMDGADISDEFGTPGNQNGL